MEVFNSLGQKILSGSCSDQSTTFDIPDGAAGIYTLKISAGNQNLLAKISVISGIK
jgi:hypothetical protein